MQTMTPDPRHSQEIPDFLNRVKTQPPMPDAQRRAVLTLTTAQALRVHNLCCERDPKFPRIENSDALGITEEGAAAKALLLAAVARGNGVAELVSNCLRDRRADPTVEQLTGRTIQRIPERGRNAPPAKVTPAPPRARGSRSAAYGNDDTVLTVVPNPKKKGGAPYARYEHYAVGLTIAQCIAKGLTPADIVWDLRHDFVTTTKAVQP